MTRHVFVWSLFCGAAMAATPCEKLSELKLDGATITSAAPGTAANVPAHCRVAGVLTPSADSHIEFEVWMPASGWNGKFQGLGNGGFAGSIEPNQLRQAVSKGYAAAASDTGHHGTAIDAAWAIGHPEKLIDFGYRAIHETAVKGKAIVTAFYGSAPTKSYFHSCSNGGRQALMEVQRYPADYDGVIAGAPANNWTHLLTLAVSNLRALLDEQASFIPPAKLPAITKAALAACDSTDGVKDGVIENPGGCGFDPAVLQCKEAESDACLTTPQLAALKKLYGGLHNAKGELIFPGYSPGGEAETGSWAVWITGPAPAKSLMYAFGMGFYGSMVYENASWDFHKFDVDRDMKEAEHKLGSVMNSRDPDLKKFHDRGGKLIIYHGWSDAAIPAKAAIDYYQSVQKKMGERAAADFVRLYMVPGMQHCGGGSGCTQFDMQAPIEAWVEQGKAPAQVIARGNAGRTHPLCAYPAVAKYSGAGSTDDAANFTCGK
jgi:feruloyl esterase